MPRYINILNTKTKLETIYENAIENDKEIYNIKTFIKTYIKTKLVTIYENVSESSEESLNN